MSSSSMDASVPDLVCHLDNVQGIVDALTSVRWKRHQDAVVELSEHGIVLIVEETVCLQAKVYLQKELFVKYDFTAHARPRFGVSLGLLVDCLNTFSVPKHSGTIELRYPGIDMQLILKSIDSLDACIYAEIRTRIPDTFSWDYNFEPAGTTPLSFTVKCASLKEANDDLEWPGSSIKITLQPVPPVFIFRGEGHGDLQNLNQHRLAHVVRDLFPSCKVSGGVNGEKSVMGKLYPFMGRHTTIDLPYYVNTDLLAAFNCDREVSHRYKYKFLKATTSNIPTSVIKDNRGTKVTVGRGGMLKIQHLVSVARPSHPHIDSAGYQPPSRIAYIEFFVKPEEPDDD